MKCIVCKGSDIELKTVDEQIRTERDIILVPMNILVCSNCGERYYDRKSMRKIEEIRNKLKNLCSSVKICLPRSSGRLVRLWRICPPLEDGTGCPIILKFNRIHSLRVCQPKAVCSIFCDSNKKYLFSLRSQRSLR
jgi:YgiT-type zinc finger domain-containing protein